jgi:hypothetical protein
LPTITLRRLAAPAAALAATLALAVPAMAREAEPGDDHGGRVAATLAVAAPAGAANLVEIRRGRGRDDAVPHLRPGRGRDDAAGHVRHGRGRDDPAGHR